jgi:imidazolonepropionase-like amidohydrolase
MAWAVHGVELPNGDEPMAWWIDGLGAVHDRPIADADLLPGRFVLPGLADAHAHPAVGPRARCRWIRAPAVTQLTAAATLGSRLDA